MVDRKDSKGDAGSSRSDKKDDKKERFQRTPMPQVDFNKKVKLEFCHNIYCMSDGAKYSYKRVKNELGLEDGATTEDGIVTIDKCGCLGHCGKGPNVKITYTEEGKSDVAEKMNAFKAGELVRPYKRKRK